MRSPSRLRTALGTLGNWRGRFSAAAEGAAGVTPLAVVDGDLLQKLDRLSLVVGRDLVNGLMGEHRASRRTSGIEFADYRQYSAGDDLRRVDWNAYARLGTLHVRQSQAEHDTVLYLLVDCTRSMAYGYPSKFLSARRLAASLGYIALAHLDAVVVAAAGAWPGSSQPSGGSGAQRVVRGRGEAGSLFRYLQDLKPSGPEPLDARLAGWAAAGPGRGRVAVVISDLLLDEYKEGVRQLVASGYSVLMLHILAPEELDPQERGDLELVDAETGDVIEVNLGNESVREYKRRLDMWLADTEAWCRGQGAQYLLVRSDWDVERVMLDTLRRRGITA